MEEEEEEEEWRVEASGEDESGRRQRRSGSSGRALQAKDSDPESTRDEIDSDGILHFRCGAWLCGPGGLGDGCPWQSCLCVCIGVVLQPVNPKPKPVSPK